MNPVVKHRSTKAKLSTQRVAYYRVNPVVKNGIEIQKDGLGKSYKLITKYGQSCIAVAKPRTRAELQYRAEQ